MLINGSRLPHTPVLSLHIGGPIAQTTREIINPHDFQIIAFELEGNNIGTEAGNLLDVRSIREVSSDGFIIDSADELVSSGDVIKLDDVMKLHFQLLGLKVETKKGSRLGKVIDYIVNTDDFRIYQLIVKRPLLKSLSDSELTIHRDQITEVTDSKIIIKEEQSSASQSAPVQPNAFMPNFVNPFRESSLSPVQNQTPDAPGTA